MDEQKERQKDVVCYPRKDIIAVLEILNQIVVSFDRIGSSYHDDPDGLMRATDSFIDNWDISSKLSHTRTLLSDAFSDEVGADDMDELERELQDVEYWSLDHQKPVKKWRKKR